jgi:hypothetical protein
MLKAYLDESGIHGGAKVCVVAGFVAPAEFCDDLACAWGHHLKSFGVTSFHAKPFASGSGQFSGWHHDDRQNFIARSILLLEQQWKGSVRSHDARNDVVFVASSIETQPFMALSLPERRWLTGGVPKDGGRWKHQGAPSKSYFVPFQQCVAGCLQFAPYRERVNFVFDWQLDYEHNARKIFNGIKRRYEKFGSRMGAIVYESRHRAVPLQVADFVAYEAHRLITASMNHKPARSAFMDRIHSQPWGGAHIDAAGLRQLLALCPISPRQSFIIPEPIKWTPARTWWDQESLHRRALAGLPTQ